METNLLRYDQIQSVEAEYLKTALSGLRLIGGVIELWVVVTQFLIL